MTRFDSDAFQRLTARIVAELGQAAGWLRSTRGVSPEVGSIFFGGGTPSLLPAEHLAAITDAIGGAFAVRADAEITIEANPETVSEAFVAELRRRTPFNRVSLGAQSFRPELLRKLERLGSRDSTVGAVERLHAGGFANLNLDLIFAIPGQSVPDLLGDLEAAIALGPRHLSAYNLTLKPGHALYGQLPDDDRAADLYELASGFLQARGYERYEISNYALAGAPSRHNWLYWSGGDYLGVGPSAASRFRWDGRFYHRKQWSDLPRYLGQTDFPEPAFEPTTWGQTVLEATFLELRTNRGVDLSEFVARYGYDLRRAAKYPRFLEWELLREEGGRICLTPKGILLADTITSELVDLAPQAERTGI